MFDLLQLGKSTRFIWMYSQQYVENFNFPLPGPLVFTNRKYYEQLCEHLRFLLGQIIFIMDAYCFLPKRKCVLHFHQSVNLGL